MGRRLRQRRSVALPGELVDEGVGLSGSFGDGGVEAVIEYGVGYHGWDPYTEAGGGGDEGLTDVAGEELGTAHATRRHSLEAADHAAYRAEESDHRSDVGHDAEIVGPLGNRVFFG